MTIFSVNVDVDVQRATTEIVVNMSVAAFVAAVKMIATVAVPVAGERWWQDNQGYLCSSHSFSQVDEGKMVRETAMAHWGRKGGETAVKGQSKRVVVPPPGEMSGIVI